MEITNPKAQLKIIQDKIYLNNEIAFDLPALLDTRLLIQANSGGGKSWLIRRILEQSYGKTQQIIIDLEGEFSTLREGYEYLVIGKGGDTAIPPDAAGLLAQKLLEYNASAILDLYEFSPQERKHFVRLFLEAMVNAPKELWHPCLVIIDEAHVFCPEKGQSEAAAAVIDLATRGRKRGFCAVLATQRLSKLHKDAAAECNNKLIGRTGLDVDMKRASEELGFASKSQYLSLRKLEAGEFFAYGPAISQEVIEVKIGPVQTSHPKAGSRILTSGPTPPTQKIRHILSKLEDLPQEAAQEAQTMTALKTQVAQLERKLNLVKREEKAPSKEIIDAAIKTALQNQQTQFDQRMKDTIASAEQIQLHVKEIRRILATLLALEEREHDCVKPSTEIVRDEVVIADGEEKLLPGGAIRIARVLASRYPVKFNRIQLGTLAHLSPRGGSYNRYLSVLQDRGLIRKEGNVFLATEQGVDEFGGNSANQENESADLIDVWKRNLPDGAKRMFEALILVYPEQMLKEELAKRTNLSVRGGAFGTYLAILKNNGLIERRGQYIKSSETLFLS